MKGAGQMKSLEVEDAQGMAPLGGGRASRLDVQGCGGHSGRKGTRMNSRPSQRASGHLWLQPGSGDKQEKGLEPGLCAVGVASEATKDT